MPANFYFRETNECRRRDAEEADDAQQHILKKFLFSLAILCQSMAKSTLDCDAEKMQRHMCLRQEAQFLAWRDSYKNEIQPGVLYIGLYKHTVL